MGDSNSGDVKTSSLNDLERFYELVASSIFLKVFKLPGEHCLIITARTDPCAGKIGIEQIKQIDLDVDSGKHGKLEATTYYYGDSSHFCRVCIK
jgi:hypothetical protein